MKKKLMTMVLGMLIAVSSTFAFADPVIDPKVLDAFEKDFSYANNAVWEEDGDLLSVRFSFNYQGLVAWYNDEAKLVGIARNIQYMQLPLAVIRTFEANYKNASVLSIDEITKDEETFYLINIDDIKVKRMLKAYPSGRIDRIKKTKK